MEGEPEQGVDDQVAGFEFRGEGFRGREERDREVVQLFLEAREDRLVRGLRVVYCGFIAEVVQVAGCHEPIAAIVAGPGGDEDLVRAFRGGRVYLVD